MTNSSPLVLPFSQIRTADLPLVGGKGANLGEMTSAGFPIPPGFCLTTAAFRRFVDSCPQADALYTELDALTAEDLDAVRDVGARLRTALLETPIPADLRAAALDSWQSAGSNAAYAVRSSATAEDLPGASFAGQQETYLNIRGADSLLDAVRQCWASLFTDRAILYRIQNGFEHRQVALSVVVQQMVFAKESGILFTADPVTGHRHTLTIDASFGLGEALVGGLVTPDTYHVDKRTRIILDRQIADKKIGIFPEEGGGTHQIALDESQRNQTVLTDQQILALADLGSRIEAHYGQPQDIEWAIAPVSLGDARWSSSAERSEGAYRDPGGACSERSVGEAISPSEQEIASSGLRPPRNDIFILQSRPITSLYPIENLGSPDGTLHIFFSMGHQQGMTRPMAPLSLSSFPLLLPIGRNPDGFTTPYLRFSGGRMYVDLTLLLHHPLLRRVVFALLSQFDILAPQMFRALMSRPEFRASPSDRIRLHPAHLRFFAGILRRVFTDVWRRDLTGFTARTNVMIDDFIADFRSRLHAVPPGKPRLQAVRENLSRLAPFFLNWVPEAAAGVAATHILPRLAQRHLTPEETDALTLGIPGNVVNEMNLAIRDLADLARQSPALVAHFEHLSDKGHAWLSAAVELPGSAPFLDAWYRFLEKYGARGPSEIDIAAPRWHEDPLPLLRVIAGNLQGDADRYRTQWETSVREREASFEKLLRTAGRGPLDRLQVRLSRRLYHVVTEVGGMREHHKLAAIQALWEVKQVLYPCRLDIPVQSVGELENLSSGETVAELLVRAGKLERASDIWFLEWRDLFAIWDDDATDWRALVARRRADQEHYRRLRPPIIISSDGETPAVGYTLKDMPPGGLVGNPISSGVVEGVAHVVRDPQREQLQPGEILVAEFTDPGWTPLFINAAGLVLEVGGALTHGAVIAREYGIPAVVGVRSATTKIRTGQRLRVDGHRGVVEIL